jgi:hypothetical protein
VQIVAKALTVGVVPPELRFVPAKSGMESLLDHGKVLPASHMLLSVD